MEPNTNVHHESILRVQHAFLAMAAVILAVGMAQASDPYVYPSRGQSMEQTAQDKYSCYQWASKQTGFDPMAKPTATSAPPPQEGGILQGAAGGAALGAIGGVIAGDTGKGAAIGAALGGLLGGIQEHQSDMDRDQWAHNQAVTHEQRRNEYNRAWGACLEGRGYTVK